MDLIVQTSAPSILAGIDERWIATAERLLYRAPGSGERMRQVSDLRTRAYHEAGHAIMLEIVARPVAGATVDGRRAAKGASGQVWTGAAPSKHRAMLAAPERLSAPVFTDRCEIVLLFLWAAVYYAGREAEHLLHGHDPRGWISGEWHDDHTAEFLLSGAFRLTGSSAPYAGAQLLARLMLREHWHQVQAVAELLLIEKTIEGDAIRRAMASAKPALPVFRGSRDFGLSRTSPGLRDCERAVSTTPGGADSFRAPRRGALLSELA